MMRVSQVLSSTLLWSLNAAARSRRKGAIVPVSLIPPTQWPSVPTISRATKATRFGSLLRAEPPRYFRQATGRTLLELRAGANMGGVMTKFTKSIKSIQASKTKSWILLLLCICNETGAVTLTKKAHDSSDPRLLAVALVMYLVTLLAFAVTLGQIDVSIAYAAWSAIGTAIVSMAGILFFNERYNWKKWACLVCIIVGVAGLNLMEEH